MNEYKRFRGKNYYKKEFYLKKKKKKKKKKKSVPILFQNTGPLT